MTIGLCNIVKVSVNGISPACGTPPPSEAFTMDQILYASDPIAGDNLGSVLAMSADGTIAAVGARNKQSVYIFEFDGEAWSQTQQLVGSDTVVGDEFGRKLAISDDGDYIIVGAAEHNSGQGAAYIFFRENTTWAEQQKVSSPDLVNDNLFGNAFEFDASATRVVIGSNKNDLLTRNVYVYTRSGTTWLLEQTLTASDDTPVDRFSTDVSINNIGNVIAVGASRRNSNDGATYIFLRSGTTWTQTQIITPELAGDRAGAITKLSKTGRYLAVVSGGPVTTGRINVYRWDSETESFISFQQLAPVVDQTLPFIYGSSLVFAKETNDLIVGVLGDDTTAEDAGAAIVYKFNESSERWAALQVLYPTVVEDTQNGNIVGCSSDARKILLGARFLDNTQTDQGGVYFFQSSFDV